MRSLQSIPERVDAIAIGASAGGVEALGLLLPALPASLRVPVFIVLHLPRDRPSQLVDIFAPKCARPVWEPVDKQPVEPGAVYFAPPDYHMLVDAGPQIALSADGLVCFSRPSIDVLFGSAADFYGDRLLGILLTGANEDGTEGVADVHRAGGVTVVQRPEDAYASFMIVSALKRTAADCVLSLAEIAGLLRGFDEVK
jgi:two-component system, chemotaxis family, protein-glutamate methylesterase/glutaminase